MGNPTKQKVFLCLS